MDRRWRRNQRPHASLRRRHGLAPHACSVPTGSSVGPTCSRACQRRWLRGLAPHACSVPTGSSAGPTCSRACQRRRLRSPSPLRRRSRPLLPDEPLLSSEQSAAGHLSMPLPFAIHPQPGAAGEAAPPPPLHPWVSSTCDAHQTSSPPARRPTPANNGPCRCALPLHRCPQSRRTPLSRPKHLYSRCVSFSGVHASGVSRLKRPCNASLSFNLLPLSLSFPLLCCNCLPLLHRRHRWIHRCRGLPGQIHRCCGLLGRIHCPFGRIASLAGLLDDWTRKKQEGP